MKNTLWGLLFCLFCVCPSWLYGQEASASLFFDPEQDPVLSEINGRIRFVVSEDVIVRATDLRFTKLGDIESVEKKERESGWYIFITGREKDHVEQSIVVILKLRRDGTNWYAAHSWNACVGDSCGSCGYDESGRVGCFCQLDDPENLGTSGFCYNIWSTDPLLMKTSLKANKQ